METKTEKLPITKKKQLFVGTKELVDTETGEIYPVQLKQIEERDFNFTKVWLRMFIEGLDGIANKKMRLAFWIIENLDSENKLVFTFRRMAEETGLSYPTVVRTMKELQQGDPPFLKKLQSGAYIINPDILYKGSHQGRMGVIYKFGSVPTKESIEKKKAMDEQEKTKAGTSTDTDVTDTVNTAESATNTEETATDTTTTETITAEVVTDTSTATKQRKGKTPKPKPENWSEIKTKIIAKEITKIQALQELGIKSRITLNKWLAEE